MIPNNIAWQAFAVFDKTGQAAVVTTKRGCSVAYSGVGIWDVTLDEPIDSTEFVGSVQESEAAAFIDPGTLVNVKIIHTTDTVKQIRTYDTAALADGMQFSLCFGKLQIS